MPHATLPFTLPFSTLPPFKHCFLSYLFTSPLSRGRTLPVALPPSPYRFSSPVSVLGLVFGPPIRSSLLVARYSNARTYSTNIRLMYLCALSPPVRRLARSTRISTAMFYTTLFSLSLSFPLSLSLRLPLRVSLYSSRQCPSRRSDKCAYRRCVAELS